jgi:putative ABC transport system ATP-binding protein
VSPSSEGPVLDVSGVHRFYRSGDDAEVAALKDVSFSIEPGQLVAVIGQSGSGKSTLLNLLAGLENPDGGSVAIDGRRISHRTGTEQALWRGAAIGVLTQSSGLLDHLTVEGNVDLAAFVRRRARTSRRARGLGLPNPEVASSGPTPSQLLERVGLAARTDARPSTLSGGETARANLAVALAGSPAVLLADEPTAEISRTEEQDVLHLIDQLRPHGGATVIVTHSDAVARAADRIFRLDGGVLQ